MKNYVQLKDPVDPSNVQTFKLGWCWAGLFFGPFVPFFRNEKKYGIYGLLVYPYLLPLIHLWMALMYNGYYVLRKIEKEGWRPASLQDEALLHQYLNLSEDKKTYG